MNYRKVYMLVINQAKNQRRKRFKGVYYELHHILPKSLFPNWINKKSNKVLLTPREHYFCHQLLNKIFPNKRMFLALWRLVNGLKQKYCSSKEYEKLKIQYVEKYCKNNNWGIKNKGKKRTEEQKKLISEKTRLAMLNVDRTKLATQKGKKWWTNGSLNKLDFICPNGWYAGRSNVNWTDRFKEAQKYWINHERPKGSKEKSKKAWETRRKNFNSE